MRRPSLFSIFLTIFIDLLGFGLVIPFLAEEARDTFHASAFVGTLLGSSYSLMQFLFVPVWGRLSDRIGRRPVLVFSIGATALSMLGLGLTLAYAESVAWLFAMRVLTGIATANLGTASAYIADITTPENRARGMGMIGMAFGLGFILGPAFGGLLATFPINGRHGAMACFAASGLSAINFVWVLRGLAESLPPEKRGKALVTKRSLMPLNFALIARTLEQSAIRRAVCVNFLIVLAFTNLDQTFRYFHKDMFQMTPLETGGAFAFIGIVAAAVQGGLMRVLVKVVSEATLVSSGAGLQAIAFLIIAVSPTVGRWMLFAGGAVLAIGNGLSQPGIAAYISKRVEPTEQGATLSTSQSAASLARVFGPATGGFLYGVSPYVPYVSAAIWLMIAFIIAIPLVQYPSRSQSPI